jgi:hypothetical protein
MFQNNKNLDFKGHLHKTQRCCTDRKVYIRESYYTFSWTFKAAGKLNLCLNHTHRKEWKIFIQAEVSIFGNFTYICVQVSGTTLKVNRHQDKKMIRVLKDDAVARNKFISIAWKQYWFTCSLLDADLIFFTKVTLNSRFAQITVALCIWLLHGWSQRTYKFESTSLRVFIWK